MSALATPTIPTYKSSAAFLERETGSGVKLAAWTLARTLLIAPPFMLVGVDTKKAFMGAAIASVLISSFAVLKIYNAGPLAGPKSRRRRRR